MTSRTEAKDKASSPTEKLVNFITNKTALALAVVIAITAGLTVPFLTMQPTESASAEPDGPVIEARDVVSDRFVSSIFENFYTIESADGNIANADEINALLDAQERLQTSEDHGDKLFSYFSTTFGQEINGVFSLATVIEIELTNQGKIDRQQWADADIQSALGTLIETYGVESQDLGLSIQTVNEDGRWVVPAITAFTLFDNEELGFKQSVTLGADTEPEEFSREIQDIMRADNDLAIYGTAIDVNLTSQEQGELAGPFIGFTILAVVLIVGYTFRSYWAVAVTGVAFSILLVWLKGISNLIGFKDDLVLSLIVPIAMVSFGVDFIFHAFGRYRETAKAGKPNIAAITTGLVAVSGALTLALASDATAFLSNLTSGIESINQFGIGAAIALASAFLLLGYVAPVVIAKLEQRTSRAASSTRRKICIVVGAVLAGMMSMATVLFLVFIEPTIGIVLLAITALLTVALPFFIASRKPAEEAPNVHEPFEAAGRFFKRLTGVIAGRPVITTLGAVVATVGLGLLAIQVPVKFDVEDFFSTDTDFVISLNQIDEHVGDRGGEQAVLLIEGDLTSVENLEAIKAELDEFAATDSEHFAKSGDELRIEGGILQVLEEALSSDAAAGAIQATTGVDIVDASGSGIPDSSKQIQTIIEFGETRGIPFSETNLALTPNDIATQVDLAEDGDATIFTMFLINSREQSSIDEAQDQLEALAERIEASTTDIDVQPTGGPFERSASLEATSNALLLSLPVAIIVCFLIASFVLRSIRLGLISVTPIVMVVSWLYGIMYLLDFSINLVTATIAAVSVGIGIDFAIHYVARFVEERDNGLGVKEALEATSASTGVALAASAASSIVGFGILALAPMPLFSTYGFLTALMIALALLSAFTVLPGLLALGKKD